VLGTSTHYGRGQFQLITETGFPVEGIPAKNSALYKWRANNVKTLQNTNFSAIWMILGSRALVTTPKTPGPALISPFGLLN